LHSIAPRYDSVFLEDRLNNEVGLSPAQDLGDSRIYWRIGCTYYHGRELADELIQRDKARWVKRSWEDTRHADVKLAVRAAQLDLYANWKRFQDAAALRAYELIVRDAPPVAFPENFADTILIRRSHIMVRNARAIAEERGARTALLIMGATHEPEVYAGLADPRHGVRRMQYHIPGALPDATSALD